MADITRQTLPLKQAFCQIWEEWLLLSPSLLTSAEPKESLVQRMVEETSILAKRVYRSVVMQAGTASAKDAQTMQYAFVALLDEVLLFSDWSGQSSWQLTPLEFRLFGTRTAGESLPDDIEQMLARQDPSERDLAAVYLMTLVLGFRGRLRMNPKQYGEWCKALFAQVYQREPDHHRLGAVLEAGCMGQPLQLSERKMLPDGFRLGLMIAGLLLVMLVLSQLFWRDIYLSIELANLALSEAKL
jgi:type VI secretion system protein ImpK